jgi:hypothetical protein
MLRSRLFFLLLLASAVPALAQGENPIEYMRFFSDRDQELSQKYLSYMSEVAHGHRARKMEKRRQEVIAEIRQSLGDATRARPFKSDASLRDVYKNYWDILLKVFNEDYHKIVDMEEIAEQSYDNMEAYLLAQEKAGEVLHTEAAKIEPVYKKFAENNNVKLIDGGDSKMAKKLRKVGRVNEYYHHLFLIFFKSFKQEVYVWDAINRKDVNALEQNNNTLQKFADEGLASLDTLKAFEGDGSLINNCRKVLEFYKNEAKNQIPAVSDYLLKSDEFDKVKKNYDGKPAAKRTQADIDTYNQSVGEMNKSVNIYNKVVNDSNEARTKVLQNWDNAVKRFMDSHVPNAK